MKAVKAAPKKPEPKAKAKLAPVKAEKDKKTEAIKLGQKAAGQSSKAAKAKVQAEAEIHRRRRAPTSAGSRADRGRRPCSTCRTRWCARWSPRPRRAVTSPMTSSTACCRRTRCRPNRSKTPCRCSARWASTSSNPRNRKKAPTAKTCPPRPTGREVATTEKAEETYDRTDDPVRMYLREMGSVELLSREGEIAIAKRIEAGRELMIGALCEGPLTFEALTVWRDELNEGKALLRDIIDLEAMYGGVPGPDGQMAVQPMGRADPGPKPAGPKSASPKSASPEAASRRAAAARASPARLRPTDERAPMAPPSRCPRHSRKRPSPRRSRAPKANAANGWNAAAKRPKAKRASRSIPARRGAGRCRRFRRRKRTCRSPPWKRR